MSEDDSPLSSFPEQITNRFKQVEGTQVGDLMLSRVEQDRVNYTKMSELMSQVKVDNTKLLPYLPVFFRTTPETRLNNFVQNQIQLFNSHIGNHCLDKCGGKADDEECMSKCKEFMQGAVDTGVKHIELVHKGYFYSKLGEEE